MHVIDTILTQLQLRLCKHVQLAAVVGADSGHAGLVLTQMLENANEYIIHGFAYRDWAREIPKPNLNVAAYGPVGGVNLNRAMSVVYNEVSILLIIIAPH